MLRMKHSASFVFLCLIFLLFTEAWIRKLHYDRKNRISVMPDLVTKTLLPRAPSPRSQQVFIRLGCVSRLESGLSSARTNSNVQDVVTIHNDQCVRPGGPPRPSETRNLFRHVRLAEHVSVFILYSIALHASLLYLHESGHQAASQMLLSIVLKLGTFNPNPTSEK
ncbi:hypothetical protein BDR07DRAFT_629483 [Suillus spraguei]|nr:hypothetical protein BDR07DRAFT_629483 [Suillus spraguei]